MLFVGAALIGMFDVRCSMFDAQCSMSNVVVLYCDECQCDTNGSSSLYGRLLQRPQRSSIHFPVSLKARETFDLARVLAVVR